jgi:hypothetical protein
VSANLKNAKKGKMSEKTFTLNGREYKIKVEKLADNSFDGKILRDEKCIVKMNLSELDADDLRKARSEDAKNLILRLLESYAKSGFIIGKAN